MSKTIYPKKCVDCLYSRPGPDSSWELRCHNPVVNSKDKWALATTVSQGTNPLYERDRGGWLFWKKPCGMHGELWEPKA